MTIDNWTSISIAAVNFLVAAGTITLAIVALKTIKYTRNEYRNEQLDRVIDWATSVTETESDKELNNIEKGLSFNAEYTRKLFSYGQLRRTLRQGNLMILVARKLKEEPLQNAIGELKEKVNEQLTLLGIQMLTLIDNFTNPNITISKEYLERERKILGEMRVLEKTADKLINLTNKLKK